MSLRDLIVVNVNAGALAGDLAAGAHADDQLAGLGLDLNLGGDGDVGSAVDVDTSGQQLLSEGADSPGVSVVGVGELLGELQLGGGLGDGALQVSLSLQADQVGHLALHEDRQTEVGRHQGLVGQLLEHVVVVDGVLSADLLQSTETRFLDCLQDLLLHYVDVTLVEHDGEVDVVAQPEPGASLELRVSPGRDLQLGEDLLHLLVDALLLAESLQDGLVDGVQSRDVTGELHGDGVGLLEVVLSLVVELGAGHSLQDGVDHGGSDLELGQVAGVDLVDREVPGHRLGELQDGLALL